MQARDWQRMEGSQVSSYFPRQKLLTALNDSQIGVVICDRRMRYKALNEKAAKIHNVPIEAHLGHFFHEIIGNMADKVVPLWEKVFKTGEPLPNLEVTGHLPKRSEVGRWIENLFPLTDDRGRVAQVGCFVIELTPPSTSSQNSLSSLSPREREVVRLVAEGKTNKEIASALAISVRTVETHRARLMLKLNATSVVQIVHYAIRNHIIAI